MADNKDDLDAELDQILSSDDELDAIVGDAPVAKPTDFNSSVSNRIYDNTIGGVKNLYNLFSESVDDPVNAIPITGPAIAALKQLGLTNTLDLVGSSAAQFAGGVAGSPGGIPGMAAGAAGGQALYDKGKQWAGVSEDIPASQEMGNFTGDVITNTAMMGLGPVLKALGLNKLGGSKLADPTNPQTAKLVDASKSLELLSPDDAAKIKAGGRISKDKLATLNQAQTVLTGEEGAVTALGGWGKRANAAIGQASKAASAFADDAKGLVQAQLDKLRGAPTVEDAAMMLDDHLNGPDGIMTKRAELIKNAAGSNQPGSKLNKGDLVNLQDELRKTADDLDLASPDVADELRALSSEGGPYGRAIAKNAELGIDQLNNRIVAINKELRASGQFDASRAGNAIAGNTSATTSPAKLDALRAEKSILEKVVDDRLDKVYEGYGWEHLKKERDRINAEYKTLSPLLEQMETFANETRTGLVSKPTSSLKGNAVNPSELLTRGGRAKALLGMMFKEDPYAVNRQALDTNYGRMTSRVGAAADLLDLGSNPANLSTAPIYDFNLLKTSGQILALSPKPALPRTVEINDEAIFDAMLKHLAPEDAQAMMQSVQQAERSGDETVKKKAYGAMLATVPELREEFEPGKTIASSEFDGIIADPNEKRALKMKISAAVRSGNGSTIDAAKFVSNLNADTPFKTVPKPVRQPKNRVYNMFDDLGAFEPGLQPVDPSQDLPQ